MIENSESTECIQEHNKPPSFRVSRWAAWTPQLNSREKWEQWAQNSEIVPPFYDGSVEGEDPLETPSVRFLPIPLRKRLSALTKLVLYLTHSTLEEDEQSSTRLVFSSRFGESRLLLDMLESIGRDEPCSPMAFSRSVHNSALGLCSIAGKNKTSNVAVSAMEASFQAGLTESVLQLFSNSEKRVLYLFIDEAVPDAFASFVNFPSAHYGAAFLLEPQQDGLNFANLPLNGDDMDCLTFLHHLLS